MLNKCFLRVFTWVATVDHFPVSLVRNVEQFCLLLSLSFIALLQEFLLHLHAALIFWLGYHRIGLQKPGLGCGCSVAVGKDMTLRAKKYLIVRSGSPDLQRMFGIAIDYVTKSNARDLAVSELDCKPSTPCGYPHFFELHPKIAHEFVLCFDE